MEQRRKTIHTERLSMSIGELQGLYERKEVDIHPKFQRILRWSLEQKTKLIESLLLRIPVPPIFVAADEKGYWDVVDGVQRLGTILEFLGVLRNAEGEDVPPLVLMKTQLLPQLAGTRFGEVDPGDDNDPKKFEPALQLEFKRSRLDLHIIQRESDPSSKYELFERLNTGGSAASDQEVRNCVLVWMNEPFYDWMRTLAQSGAFFDCIQLTDRLEKQQYRMELLLRFLAFRRRIDSELEINDLGEFLNAENRRLATDTALDRDKEATVLNDTFGLLFDALETDAFRKYDPYKQKFLGGFLISAYEAVALGVAHNISKWKKTKSAASVLSERVKTLWEQEEFTDNIGIGVPARERIQHSVPFGRKHFTP